MYLTKSQEREQSQLSNSIPKQSMAEIAKEVNGGDARDLHSLLSSPARDFLIRNNGEQVINVLSLFSQLISTSVVFFWLMVSL